MGREFIEFHEDIASGDGDDTYDYVYCGRCLIPIMRENTVISERVYYYFTNHVINLRKDTTNNDLRCIRCEKLLGMYLPVKSVNVIFKTIIGSDDDVDDDLAE